MQFTSGKDPYTAIDFLTMNQIFLSSINSGNSVLSDSLVVQPSLVNFDVKRVTGECRVVSVDPVSKDEARLAINFSENQLVTHFRGEKNRVKLSCALGILRDLSELFAAIKEQAKTNSIESEQKGDDSTKGQGRMIAQLTSVLACEGAFEKDSEFVITEKLAIRFFPSKGRVVLMTSRGQSSTPLSMVQSCAHLFNSQFVKQVGPQLGLDNPSASSVQNAILQTYIGRCAAGVVKAVQTNKFTEQKIGRELGRLVCHVKMPGHAFYSKPIA